MAKEKTLDKLSKAPEMQEVIFKLGHSQTFLSANSVKEIKDILYKTIAQNMNLKSAEEFHSAILLLHDRFEAQWEIPSLSTVRRDLLNLNIVKTVYSYYKYIQPIYSMSRVIELYCSDVIDGASLFSIYIPVDKNSEKKIAHMLFELYHSCDYFFSVSTNIGSVQVLSNNEFILDEICSGINDILSKS